jgi:subtilisin family serine protease
MRSRATAAALLLGVAADARAELPVAAAQPFAARMADARGRVPLLVRVPAGRTAAELGLLPVAPGIGAVRVAPEGLDAFLGLDAVVAPRLTLSLDRAGGWTRAVEAREDLGLRGAGVVVGVIDAGFDVAHPAFRDAMGGTRVAWMLTAGAPRGLHPELEEAFGCDEPDQAPCSVLAAADIDALLAMGELPDDLRDPVGHGTHVASIAAGNGGASLPAMPRYVGVAPEATLVLVAIAGGELLADGALRGARFVFDRAEALGEPAVVNLSAGHDAGLHDGSSLFETGLAAFVADDAAGRAIVVAAGNTGSVRDRGDGVLRGTHATVELAPGQACRVPVRASDGYGAAELWVAFDTPGSAIGFEDAGGTAWFAPAPAGETLDFDDGAVHATLTAAGSGAVLRWEGEWDGEAPMTLLLAGSGHADAWIGASGPVEILGALRDGTVTIPASHPDLIAVGASVNRASWPAAEGQATPFFADEDGVAEPSAAGPSLAALRKPDLVAPGANVVAAMSADADPRAGASSLFTLHADCDPPDAFCLVVDDSFGVSGGTSMATPQVTGAVALLFERDPTLGARRARELLVAGARRPTGASAPEAQLGAGMLDVRASLDAMEDGAAAVDAGASFWVLSASFARRGGRVLATLHLRGAGGALAAADAERIAVAVSGGELARGPTRVAAGTFELELLAGADAPELGVTISYDGAAIGAPRTLPIGAPRCPPAGAAAEDPSCDCHTAGKPASPWPALLLGVCLVRSRSSRRRRGCCP